MRIQFDISKRPQIESGEYKVETRDGRPVKIISFEMTDTNDCPIAAQFRLCAGTPVIYLFDKDGFYKGEGDSDYDLFIVTPEPEMSEFEKALDDTIRSYRCDSEKDEDGGILDYQSWIKRKATSLLDLAKSQLLQSGELMTQGHHEKLMETLREECKKDLPRWRIWRNGACGNSDGHPIALVHGVGGIRFVSCLGANGEKYIMLSDIEKLPKDE